MARQTALTCKHRPAANTPTGRPVQSTGITAPDATMDCHNLDLAWGRSMSVCRSSPRMVFPFQECASSICGSNEGFDCPTSTTTSDGKNSWINSVKVLSPPASSRPISVVASREVFNVRRMPSRSLPFDVSGVTSRAESSQITKTPWGDPGDKSANLDGTSPV